MSANITPTNRTRTLDRTPEAPSPVTEREVQQPDVLAGLLMDLVRDVGKLQRRWWPHRIDFEGQALDATGTKLFRFEHKFGGTVRYWIVEWSGAAAPNLRKHASSTNDVLFLTSTVAGTATIRVEQAG